MTKDMTIGDPTKLIIYFSIPILIGNLFQQFYNMADAAIVGRYVGVHALSAVGATGSLLFLILGFILGFTNGFSIIIAQKFGANDLDGLRKSVSTSFFLCGILAIILTIIALFIIKPMLILMNTPDNIINDSITYATITVAGLIGVIYYNMIAGIIRALGDSKTPLYFLIVSALTNIVLDLLFIIPLRMGVAGAALATIIAQTLCGISCMIYGMKHFKIIQLKKSDWKLEKPLVMKHLSMGLPMGFQFSFIAVGALILQRALNGFGSTTIASYTAASKFEQLVTTPLNTLGSTMSTFTGQNLGAGKYDRIKIGVRKGVFITLGFSLFASCVVYFFGNDVTSLFISMEDEALAATVIDFAQYYLNILAVFFPFLGLLFLFRNTLQGMGNTLAPMVACIAELVMRIGVAFTLPKIMGFTGVCLASPIAWLSAAILLIIWYHFSIKKFSI